MVSQVEVIRWRHKEELRTIKGVRAEGEKQMNREEPNDKLKQRRR